MLRTIGALALGTSLAGCATDGAEESERPNSAYVDTEPDYDGWFDGVGNYEGTVDWRDREEVTVNVGAGSRGMSFDPPAVAVTTGTTVVWKWTGDGGGHNVVAEDGAFESETTSSEGHTFEQTFDGEATHRYVCEPHESTGMKGAVVVEDSA